jgi:hypothetical protein
LLFQNALFPVEIPTGLIYLISQGFQTIGPHYPLGAKAKRNSMSDLVNQKALKILSLLSSLPFEECYPLTKKFKDLPRQPGREYVTSLRE